jgi:hypothetical protein
MAGFASDSASIEPEGAMAGFAASGGWPRVACNGLAVDPQFARDPTLGQTLAVQGQDKVYHGHFEQIRHDVAPEKGGYPGSLSAESASPQNGWFSSSYCAHRWLVLSAR